MTVHLFDPRRSNAGAKDGEDSYCEKPGRTMSWHELKRARITCATCIRLYTEREEERRRAAFKRFGEGDRYDPESPAHPTRLPRSI